MNDVRSGQLYPLAEDKEREMTDIYAMRRANGDWFALEDHERLLVPLFRSNHDAMMARLRNFGMLLFEPVALDAQLLKEVAPAGAVRDVDFCIVNDPFANLTRGSHIERAQVDLLMSDSSGISGNGNGFHGAGLEHAASVQMR